MEIVSTSTTVAAQSPKLDTEVKQSVIDQAQDMHAAAQIEETAAPAETAKSAQASKNEEVKADTTVAKKDEAKKEEKVAATSASKVEVNADTVEIKV